MPLWHLAVYVGVALAVLFVLRLIYTMARGAWMVSKGWEPDPEHPGRIINTRTGQVRGR